MEEMVATNDETKEKISNAKSKGYKQPLISPDGTVYDKIKSLNKFAKEHNLDPSSLYKLYKGELKSVKGFIASIIAIN